MAGFGEFLINNMRTSLEPEDIQILNRSNSFYGVAGNNNRDGGILNDKNCPTIKEEDAATGSVSLNAQLDYARKWAENVSTYNFKSDKTTADAASAKNHHHKAAGAAISTDSPPLEKKVLSNELILRNKINHLNENKRKLNRSSTDVNVYNEFIDLSGDGGDIKKEAAAADDDDDDDEEEDGDVNGDDEEEEEDDEDAEGEDADADDDDDLVFSNSSDNVYEQDKVLNQKQKEQKKKEDKLDINDRKCIPNGISASAKEEKKKKAAANKRKGVILNGFQATTCAANRSVISIDSTSLISQKVTRNPIYESDSKIRDADDLDGAAASVDDLDAEQLRNKFKQAFEKKLNNKNNKNTTTVEVEDAALKSGQIEKPNIENKAAEDKNYDELDDVSQIILNSKREEEQRQRSPQGKKQQQTKPNESSSSNGLFKAIRAFKIGFQQSTSQNNLEATEEAKNKKNNKKIKKKKKQPLQQQKTAANSSEATVVASITKSSLINRSKKFISLNRFSMKNNEKIKITDSNRAKFNIITSNHSNCMDKTSEKNIYFNNTKEQMMMNETNYSIENAANNVERYRKTSSRSPYQINVIESAAYQYHRSKVTPINVNLAPPSDLDKSIFNVSNLSGSKNASNAGLSQYQQALVVSKSLKKCKLKNREKLLQSWDEVIKKASKDPNGLKELLKVNTEKALEDYKRKKTNQSANHHQHNDSSFLSQLTETSKHKLNDSKNQIVEKILMGNNLSFYLKKLQQSQLAKKSKKDKEAINKNKKNNKKSNYQNDDDNVDDNGGEDSKAAANANKKNKNNKSKEEVKDEEKILTAAAAAAAALKIDQDTEAQINQLLIGAATAGKQGELVRNLFSYLNNYGDDGFTIKPSNMPISPFTLSSQSEMTSAAAAGQLKNQQQQQQNKSTPTVNEIFENNSGGQMNAAVAAAAATTTTTGARLTNNPNPIENKSFSNSSISKSNKQQPKSTTAVLQSKSKSMLDLNATKTNDELKLIEVSTKTNFLKSEVVNNQAAAINKQHVSFQERSKSHAAAATTTSNSRKELLSKNVTSSSSSSARPKSSVKPSEKQQAAGKTCRNSSVWPSYFKCCADKAALSSSSSASMASNQKIDSSKSHAAAAAIGNKKLVEEEKQNRNQVVVIGGNNLSLNDLDKLIQTLDQDGKAECLKKKLSVYLKSKKLNSTSVFDDSMADTMANLLDAGENVKNFHLANNLKMTKCEGTQMTISMKRREHQNNNNNMTMLYNKTNKAAAKTIEVQVPSVPSTPIPVPPPSTQPPTNRPSTSLSTRTTSKQHTHTHNTSLITESKSKSKSKSPVAVSAMARNRGDNNNNNNNNNNNRSKQQQQQQRLSNDLMIDIEKLNHIMKTKSKDEIIQAKEKFQEQQKQNYQRQLDMIEKRIEKMMHEKRGGVDDLNVHHVAHTNKAKAAKSRSPAKNTMARFASSGDNHHHASSLTIDERNNSSLQSNLNMTAGSTQDSAADIEMFYFTSESPTRKTIMKTKTQKLFKGFYKHLQNQANTLKHVAANATASSNKEGNNSNNNNPNHQQLLPISSTPNPESSSQAAAKCRLANDGGATLMPNHNGSFYFRLTPDDLNNQNNRISNGNDSAENAVKLSKITDSSHPPSHHYQHQNIFKTLFKPKSNNKPKTLRRTCENCHKLKSFCRCTTDQQQPQQQMCNNLNQKQQHNGTSSDNLIVKKFEEIVHRISNERLNLASPNLQQLNEQQLQQQKQNRRFYYVNDEKPIAAADVANEAAKADNNEKYKYKTREKIKNHMKELAVAFNEKFAYRTKSPVKNVLPSELAAAAAAKKAAMMNRTRRLSSKRRRTQSNAALNAGCALKRVDSLSTKKKKNQGNNLNKLKQPANKKTSKQLLKEISEIAKKKEANGIVIHKNSKYFEQRTQKAASQAAKVAAAEAKEEAYVNEPNSSPIRSPFSTNEVNYYEEEEEVDEPNIYELDADEQDEHDEHEHENHQNQQHFNFINNNNNNNVSFQQQVEESFRLNYANQLLVTTAQYKKPMLPQQPPPSSAAVMNQQQINYNIREEEYQQRTTKDRCYFRPSYYNNNTNERDQHQNKQQLKAATTNLSNNRHNRLKPRVVNEI